MFLIPVFGDVVNMRLHITSMSEGQYWSLGHSLILRLLG